MSNPLRIGDEACGAQVTLIPPTIVLIEIHGDIPESLAAPIARAVDEQVTPLAEAWTYWNLERLTNYHSSLRVLCTQVMWKHRAKLRCLHALAKSKVVRMGVAVANLALGGIITAHSERSKFDAALEANKRQQAR